MKFNTTIDQPGEKGWWCVDSEKNECIPERYICDKTSDCPGSSDEEWGCKLYPGNLHYRMCLSFLIQLISYYKLNKIS